MAIKRLRVNEQGEHEERELEVSELPPPPPPERVDPPPVSRSHRRSSGKDAAPSTRVKVTRPATKVYAAGKTALDHDMIRFECPKCGASRVGHDPSQQFTCSMCRLPMRRKGR